MRKIETYDIIFYTCMIILLIWIFLRSAGIINTPYWLEYALPFTTFVVGFATSFQKFTEKLNKIGYAVGRLQTKTNYIERDVKELKEDVSMLKTKVSHIDSLLAKNNIS